MNIWWHKRIRCRSPLVFRLNEPNMPHEIIIWRNKAPRYRVQVELLTVNFVVEMVPLLPTWCSAKCNYQCCLFQLFLSKKLSIFWAFIGFAILEIVAMSEKERNLLVPADVFCVTKATIFILVLLWYFTSR